MTLVLHPPCGATCSMGPPLSSPAGERHLGEEVRGGRRLGSLRGHSSAGLGTVPAGAGNTGTTLRQELCCWIFSSPCCTREAAVGVFPVENGSFQWKGRVPVSLRHRSASLLRPHSRRSPARVRRVTGVIEVGACSSICWISWRLLHHRMLSHQVSRFLHPFGLLQGWRNRDTHWAYSIKGDLIVTLPAHRFV